MITKAVAAIARHRKREYPLVRDAMTRAAAHRALATIGAKLANLDSAIMCQQPFDLFAGIGGVGKRSLDRESVLVIAI